MSFNHKIIITFVISILNYCLSKIIRLFYFHINSLCCESNNFISFMCNIRLHLLFYC
nr:MAG TPA: hypothetical protein [Caudoviricetes sp.]